MILMILPLYKRILEKIRIFKIAADNRKTSIYYQPVYDLLVLWTSDDDKMGTYETLASWNNEMFTADNITIEHMSNSGYVHVGYL